MSEPIRVAHVMGKMSGGGVEAVVMNYYRHIDRSQIQFDFLVDSDSTLVPHEEIESLGGRVFEIPQYQHLYTYMKYLEGLFTEQDWLIVHSHINVLSAFSLCAAARVGVPVRIAHSHSTAGKGEYAKNMIKRLLRTQANRYPTYRMACSYYAGEWLFGKGAKFDILHNAIELDRFSFDAEVRTQVRTDLGLDGDALAIGHVGRFMPQKNHAFLIEVFAEVVRRRKDAVLILIGAGELRPEIECMVKSIGVYDRVRFLGQKTDIDQFYQAFDVFCLPSLYEGLGMVAVEAQRVGLPCILSDKITREVDVTGEVKFLPIEDPNIWANAICAKEPGGRFFVQPESFSDYDIEGAAQCLESLYLQLANSAVRS